jgi:succinate dehydrogenase/fumarate reductase flavoprotein subunit
VVVKAQSVAELAAAAGLPPKELVATVAAYNVAVDEGADSEFGRFVRDADAAGPRPSARPPRIEVPPFYAVEFFPLTRKSMGGIAIDLGARATDTAHRPIRGLYAAGEAAGLAGINGRAALEGTFLGPSVLTGRVAARTLLRDLRLVRIPADGPRSSAPAAPSVARTSDCLECHHLAPLVAARRPGYWHFERAHALVAERGLECAACHVEFGATYDARHHAIDRLAQQRSCVMCHQSAE